MRYAQTIINDSLTGKSYNLQKLPARIKSKLAQGLQIKKISLLRSPLTFTLAGQQILASFRYIIEQPMQYLKHPLDTYMAFCNHLRQNSVELMLAGMAAVNKYLRQSQNSFTFDHHQILIEFTGDLFILISFCHNQFELLASIDDFQLIQRRPHNAVLKVYQQNLSFDSRKILQYIQAKEGKPYHLLFWNCQDYCKELIKSLGLE